jgi:hypothetical protein
MGRLYSLSGFFLNIRNKIKGNQTCHEAVSAMALVALSVFGAPRLFGAAG